jgi:hypothetical protein
MSSWSPDEIQKNRKKKEELVSIREKYLPRAWEAVRAYYNKLRELRRQKTS